MVDTMYKENILELYREKPNFGKLKNKTHSGSYKNPSCDDEIIVELEIESGKIKDAKFSGQTCMISCVSASALLEKIKGMKIEDIKDITKKDIDKLLGIQVISTRIKCELAPLEALKKAIEKC